MKGNCTESATSAIRKKPKAIEVLFQRQTGQNLDLLPGGLLCEAFLSSEFIFFPLSLVP